MPVTNERGYRPLESLVVDSFAALQHVRSTVDLLPTDGAGSPTEGDIP
jgi:hypothetical protein